MENIDGLIERMRALCAPLAELAGAPLVGASDEQVVSLTVAVEDAGRLIDALRIRTAGEIGDRSAPGLGHDGLAWRLGQGKAVMLLSHLTRVSNAEAARRLKLGAVVRPGVSFEGEVLPPAFPVVAEALDRGEIGVEAAARIARALDEARRTATVEEIACAESALVESAGSETADEVGVQAIVWREFLDPDGAEPREERAHRKRAFRFGAERDGLVPFSGDMEATGAALLKAAFDEAYAAAKPRFLSVIDGGEYDPGAMPDPSADPADVPLDGVDPDSVYPDGDPPVFPAGADLDAVTVEIAEDPRTMVQRQHDVLVGLITAGTRATGYEPGGMRSTAQVTAVISLDDLKTGKGVGWVEGIDEPLSATAVQRLVHESGYATMVEGDNGETLWLTVHKRRFTWQQLRALLVRDGGCIWPGCRAKAAMTHGHHVIPWSHGGPTHIDNGVLLCPYHHGMLHSSAFSLRMIRGKPHLLAPVWIDPTQRWIPLGKSRIARLNGLRKAG